MTMIPLKFSTMLALLLGALQVITMPDVVAANHRWEQYPDETHTGLFNCNGGGYGFNVMVNGGRVNGVVINGGGNNFRNGGTYGGVTYDEDQAGVQLAVNDAITAAGQFCDFNYDECCCLGADSSRFHFQNPEGTITCAEGEGVKARPTNTTCGSCEACAAGTTFSDVVDTTSACANLSTCAEGEGVTANGTNTTDTECEACAAGTTFSDVVDTTSACADLSTCALGEGVKVNGTNTTDTECEACAAGTTFSGVVDTTSACANLSTCAVGFRVTANGTNTTDTECTDVDGCGLHTDGCNGDAKAQCSDGGGPDYRTCTCASGFSGTATGLADSAPFGGCTIIVRAKVDVKPVLLFPASVQLGTAVAASTVSDGDGISDELEEDAGTDPNDGDFFDVTETVENGDGSTIRTVGIKGSVTKTVTNVDGIDGATTLTTVTVSKFDNENVKAIATTLSTVSVENAKTIVNDLVQAQVATTVSSEQGDFAIIVITAFTTDQLGTGTQEARTFVGDLIKSVQAEAGTRELSPQQAAFVADLKKIYLTNLLQATSTNANTLDSDGDGVTDIDELLAETPTDPFGRDSGGDGVTDFEELSAEFRDGAEEADPNRWELTLLKVRAGIAAEDKQEQTEQQPQEVKSSGRKPEAMMSDIDGDGVLNEDGRAYLRGDEPINGEERVGAVKDGREAESKQTGTSGDNGVSTGGKAKANKKKGEKSAKEAHSKKAKKAKGSAGALASDSQSGAAPASSMVAIAALAAGLAFVAIAKLTTQKTTDRTESQAELELVPILSTVTGKLPSSALA